MPAGETHVGEAHADEATSDRPGSGTDAPGDPESVARLICLRLLTHAPRTRAQLAQALARRGVPDEAAAAVLERFTAVGLIDDAAFSRAWVGSRHRGRGLAGRALGQELRQRGVPAEVIAGAVAELDMATERDTAVRLVRRRLTRLPGIAPDVAARRLAGMLARKGYPAGLAYAVVRDELDARRRGRDHDPDDARSGQDQDAGVDGAESDNWAERRRTEGRPH